MSAPLLDHREATRTARSRQHPSVTEREWLGPTSPMFRVVRRPPPSRMQRFAAAYWRMHDGAVWLWAIAGVLVLLASLAAVAGLINPHWLAWLA
ncbi:hypothetical protein ISP17_11280 [Dyella ginsengisoli]|uniref:Uncharacterized protein n=1 Tax=Dyella ginsengisoli TaxID=363848 RepID=A0ABW8JTR6_9GAMM